MADDECQMTDHEGQKSEPLTEECSVPVVGQDSQLTDGAAGSEKAQNKANLEAQKGQETLEFKPETARAEGRKQSQFPPAITLDRGIRPSFQHLENQPVASTRPGGMARWEGWRQSMSGAWLMPSGDL